MVIQNIDFISSPPPQYLPLCAILALIHLVRFVPLAIHFFALWRLLHRLSHLHIPTLSPHFISWLTVDFTITLPPGILKPIYFTDSIWLCLWLTPPLWMYSVTSTTRYFQIATPCQCGALVWFFYLCWFAVFCKIYSPLRLPPPVL